MKLLFDETLARFPEISGDVRDLDGQATYLVMGELVDWLDSQGRRGFDATVIQRVVDFAKWCELQPRGDNASDDIFTVLAVGLYENLFLHEYTRSLIPHLMCKADLEANKEYLEQWVGCDNYSKALGQF